MGNKGTYETKQRKILMEYLRSTAGAHITAGDVCGYFRERGSSIGQTTVYRQLEKMVAEGIVSKYLIDSSSPACFEYIPEERQEQVQTCFHCKCEKCGRLIHMHCDELAAIEEHLSREHHFYLDPLRTVFYGVCEECRAAGEADAAGSSGEEGKE